MLLLEVLIALFLIGAFIHFQYTKRRNEYETSLISQHLNSSDELKRTLAMGLYLRFKKESEENPIKYSNIYIKEDPVSFESFVAKIIEKNRGGSTWVSPPSGDFGVDFEHSTNDGLYLGQVKCYQGDLPFDPIALIHSNMVKKNAVGGYVITTGSFTENAKKYAEGLNIELIDGIKLVDEWIASLNQSEEEIKQLVPQY